MFNLNILVTFIFSIFLSWYLLKRLMPFLNKFFIDEPNKRSSHILPKPSAGGISFVLVIIIFETILGNLQPLICLPLAIIGFYDDLKGAPKFLRYLIQFFTVLFLIINSNVLSLLPENFPSFIVVIFILFLIFSGTAIINFTNFMDGSDGIVAGSMLLIFLIGSIVIANSYIVFVGALIGFLIWNWHPSKVFMGDGGSTFLGALFVGLLFNADSLNLSFQILIILSPLIGDAFICLLRRLFNGQIIFEAHCSHLYQRLIKAGWSHSSVAILYMGCIITLAITMIIGGFKNIVAILILEFLVGFWLDQKIALPFPKSLK